MKQSNSSSSSSNHDIDPQTVASVQVEEILGAHKPKHLADGISSGLGYIVKGAVGGIGTAVLTPMVGAAKGHQEKGVVGGIVGGLGGAVGGALKAVNIAGGGVVAGVAQVVQGAAMTPKALVAPGKGYWWNANEGEWVITNLLEEERYMKEVPAYDEDILGVEAMPEEQRPESTHSKKVKETLLYDRLGLDPSVDKKVIKRRYFIIARKYSPDRTGANEKAAEEFKEIGKAYMILMNDDLRAKYDRVGFARLWEEEDPHAIDVDPLMLYTFLFGSEKFYDHIGRLAAATEASVGDDQSSVVTLEQARLLQKRRVTRLALSLANRLSKWAEDDLQIAAKAQWMTEAENLANASYGVELLHIVGKVYSLSSLQFLGSVDSGLGMPPISTWAKKQVETFKHRTSRTLANIKDYGGDADKLSLNKNVSLAVDKSEGSEKAEQVAKDILKKSHLHDTALRILWKQTVVDITGTLYEVCQMVLHDTNVSIEVRHARARGLDELGSIFQNTNASRFEQEEDLEELAFYAMLETVWRHEVSKRDHMC